MEKKNFLSFRINALQLSRQNSPFLRKLVYVYFTGCGRNNFHILKVNKNQTKQGTQKILLFIKTTHDAIFFKHV